ncbi:MAG: DUF4124 domain-containing protein [Gammaproteobacteria bacterium]|nr:DUF4124 domain-containing protein [Gammaproteobacteria bacterium]
MRIGHTVLVLSLLGALFAEGAQARVFRCTDADGKVSYSQTPCPAAQQAAEMRGMNSGKQQDRDLCRDARELAIAAFGEMGRGLEPAEVIDQYGGIDYINAAALGVINFAASLRYNTSLTPQRVGSLTFSRCRSGGFGELQPGDLPISEDSAPAQPVPTESQPGTSAAAPAPDEVDACVRYRQQLQDIERQLRPGDRGEDGEMLRQERERYQALWSTECVN